MHGLVIYTPASIPISSQLQQQNGGDLAGAIGGEGVNAAPRRRARYRKRLVGSGQETVDLEPPVAGFLLQCFSDLCQDDRLQSEGLSAELDDFGGEPPDLIGHFCDPHMLELADCLLGSAESNPSLEVA